MSVQHEFLLRSLRKGEEDRYADFLTKVFSFRNVPRQNFVRQIEHDPAFDHNSVFLATEPHGNCAAALRVFHRQLTADGSPLKFGGIGAVATDDIFRGRGLAGMLIAYSAERMVEEGENVCFLHASLDAPRRVYAKPENGFVSLNMPAIATPPTPLVPKQSRAERIQPIARKRSGATVRPVDFDSDQDLQRLKDLHTADCKAWRWPGPVVRDDAYWRQWVRAMAAMDIGVKKRRALLLEDGSGGAPAYMFATMVKDDTGRCVLTVCEFVAREEGEGYAECFGLLLAAALDHVEMDEEGVKEVVVQGLKGAFRRSETANALPTLAQVLGIPPGSISESMDPGWMVRLLKPVTVERGGAQHSLETTQDFVDFCESDPRPPVWWTTDNY